MMMMMMVMMDMPSSYGNRLHAAKGTDSGRELPVGFSSARLYAPCRGNPRPDQQYEADQDADDAERVMHEHREDDPDDDE